MTTRSRSAPPASYQHLITRGRMRGLRREDVEGMKQSQIPDSPLELTVARRLAPAPEDLPPPEFTIARGLTCAATLTCVASHGPPIEVVAVVVAVIVVEVIVVVALRVRVQ